MRSGLLLLLGAFTLIPVMGSAIVIRHDTADEGYRLDPRQFPASVDFAPEGHGVLIAPTWVLTVAHVAEFHRPGDRVHIGGTEYEIATIVIHPGYGPQPAGLAAGDAAPLLAFYRNRDDIALVGIAESVQDIAPLRLYTATDEVGKTVSLFGKGKTGNGLTGEEISTPSRGVLRQGRNVIEAAEDRWLVYTFDPPPKALHMEAMMGSGDSGGPVLIQGHDGPLVAGLASWQSWEGELTAYRGGLYGKAAYQVRVSSYRHWISSVIGVPARQHTSDI